MTTQRYTCRWLGDDELGWDDWIVDEEGSMDYSDVVEAASPKAAARAFLARGRAEAARDEPWLQNTRVGVRLRPPVEILGRADVLAPPAKGRGGSAYEVLPLRTDNDTELFGSRRGSDAWEGRYATPRDAAADFLAHHPRSEAERFAVRRAPGPVKLFLAADAESDRVVDGHPGDLNVRPTAF